MKIGIDFGTSNSAAAAVVDGRVVPIQFGQAEQFRTTVYFPEVMRDPNDFELTPALEHELARLIDAAARDARAAGQERAHDALRREALRVVRRQWMEEQMRAPLTSTKLLQNAVYGDEALEAYFEENEGNLVQSPKSMLGYNLHPRAPDHHRHRHPHPGTHPPDRFAPAGPPGPHGHAGAPGAVPQFDRRGRQRPGAGDPAQRGDRGGL
jgi:hypothetical chaperone protein